MAEKKKPEGSDTGSEVHGKPNPNAAPGQSTATDWDRPKPGNATHDDANRNPVGGQHGEQNPQLKPNK